MKKKHPIETVNRVLEFTDYSFMSSSEGVGSPTRTSICSTVNTGSEVLVSILR